MPVALQERRLMPFVSADSFDTAPQIDRRTLTDSVYEHLREQLAIGCMAPGQRLSLRELGSVLGVSVMPVREAVNRLVAERALEVTAARVLRVPLSTAQQLRDLTDIRMAMEGFAAERAALLRTSAQLDAIEAAAAALDVAAARKAGDPGDWIAMNRMLHFTIYRAAPPAVAGQDDRRFMAARRPGPEHGYPRRLAAPCQRRLRRPSRPGGAGDPRP